MLFADALLSIFCQAALMKTGSWHRTRDMKSNLRRICRYNMILYNLTTFVQEAMDHLISLLVRYAMPTPVETSNKAELTTSYSAEDGGQVQSPPQSCRQRRSHDAAWQPRRGMPGRARLVVQDMARIRSATYREHEAVGIRTI